MWARLRETKRIADLAKGYDRSGEVCTMLFLVVSTPRPERLQNRQTRNDQRFTPESDMDFFVSPTPRNAFVYRGAHVPPCSDGADAMGARGFPQSTEDRRRSG